MLMVTVVPSMLMDWPWVLDWEREVACAKADALRILPPMDSTVALRASVVMSAKRGTAKAARMPRMTITMTSSMRVKPCCLFIVSLLKKSLNL